MTVGTVKKSMAAMASRWFFKKAIQRLAGWGFLRARCIHLETALSDSSNPSIESSP